MTLRDHFEGRCCEDRRVAGTRRVESRNDDMLNCHACGKPCLRAFRWPVLFAYLCDPIDNIRRSLIKTTKGHAVSESDVVVYVRHVDTNLVRFIESCLSRQPSSARRTVVGIIHATHWKGKACLPLFDSGRRPFEQSHTRRVRSLSRGVLNEVFGVQRVAWLCRCRSCLYPQEAAVLRYSAVPGSLGVIRKVCRQRERKKRRVGID